MSQRGGRHQRRPSQSTFFTVDFAAEEVVAGAAKDQSAPPVPPAPKAQKPAAPPPPAPAPARAPAPAEAGREGKGGGASK